MNSRRRFLLQSAGLSAGAGLAGLAPTQVWSQAKATFGEMTVTTLSDGYMVFPLSFVMPDSIKSGLPALLAEYRLPADEIRADCNLTLMQDGTNTVLFDVGAGPNFLPGTGTLADAMEALALDPESVTHVVFTHAHPDHLWGLTDDFDELVFPNAHYLISAPEWDYWMDPATIDSIPADRQAFAAGAARNLELIEDRVERFKFDQEILPGILSIDTTGHTPGHTSFELRSGSESVFVIGDAITNSIISFARPDLPTNSDQDQALGIGARKMLLDRVASEKAGFVGFHLPHPGLGRAERKGNAYQYVAG